MSVTRTSRALAASSVVGMAAATLLALSATGSAAGQDEHGVAAVRNATERFSDVQVALDAGYVPVSGCEQHPTLGAMGVHYLHPELASDAKLIPTKPEVLLYEPTPEGGLQLVGVEYFIAEAAVRAGHPSVMGRPLEGPMDGHSAGMPRHYDLHLWVWKDNPSGMAATWNPAVSCEHGS